jgi:hypothetical protein
MPLSTDLRAYADSAREQGTELVTRFTTTVTGFTSAANHAVLDLRGQAGKNLNLDAVRTALEPYVAQARDYSSSVTERAEDLYGTVRNDRRVSGLFDRAETLARPVVTVVQERVVQPVRIRTRRDGVAVVEPTPAAAPKPRATSTRKPAATRPATARKAAAKKATPSA